MVSYQTFVQLGIFSPWHFHLGSFEGVLIDQETGELAACADPRRAGAAIGFWLFVLRSSLFDVRLQVMRSAFCLCVPGRLGVLWRSVGADQRTPALAWNYVSGVVVAGQGQSFG
jgi:hypothetical protein